MVYVYRGICNILDSEGFWSILFDWQLTAAQASLFSKLNECKVALSKIMAKRYIHPGARPKTATRTGTNSDCKDSQRTLDDIIKEQGNDVFTVILQAESSNSKEIEN